MKKVSILSTASSREQVLSALRDCGLMEVTELGGIPDDIRASAVPTSTSPELKQQLAELSSAISFLDGFSGEKKSLLDSIVGYKIPVSERDLSADFDHKDVIMRCKTLMSELANLQSLTGRLKEEYERVRPWRTLNVNLREMRKLAWVRVAAGRIPAKSSADFFDRLPSGAEAAIASSTKTAVFVMVFYHVSEEDAVSSLIGSSDFEKIELPDTENTPRRELERISALIEKAQAEIDLISDESRKQTAHRLKLMCVYDSILQREKDLEAESRGLRSPYLFALEGWATESSLRKLRMELSSVTSEVEVFVRDPGEKEAPPVVIKNPPYLRPFETVTRIFGLPRYTEIDPTGVLSVFFLIFFGMCLSDAGYGIAMILLSFYMLKKLQLSQGGKKLLQLLMAGGVVTIFIGALTGGWFGIDLGSIPDRFAPVKNALLWLRLVDPIKNPLPVLGISLGLGVAQVLFGKTINMAERIKAGDGKDAFLDDAPWLLFLSSIVALIVASFAFQPLAAPAKWLVLFGAVSIVLTQGRRKKGIFMKLLSGVLSLYGVTSYMGDVLSYSRLLALGMSTAIIGMVVNILAGMAGSSMPVVGALLMVAILVIGHTFNLLVSAMGAFIHSTRLELVEFFTKFFEGGGKEFKPYRRESKYTLVVNR